MFRYNSNNSRGAVTNRFDAYPTALHGFLINRTENPVGIINIVRFSTSTRRRGVTLIIRTEIKYFMTFGRRRSDFDTCMRRAWLSRFKNESVFRFRFDGFSRNAVDVARNGEVCSYRYLVSGEHSGSSRARYNVGNAVKRFCSLSTKTVFTSNV